MRICSVKKKLFFLKKPFIYNKGYTGITPQDNSISSLKFKHKKHFTLWNKLPWFGRPTEGVPFVVHINRFIKSFQQVDKHTPIFIYI